MPPPAIPRAMFIGSHKEMNEFVLTLISALAQRTRARDFI